LISNSDLIWRAGRRS